MNRRNFLRSAVAAAAVVPAAALIAKESALRHTEYKWSEFHGGTFDADTDTGLYTGSDRHLHAIVAGKYTPLTAEQLSYAGKKALEYFLKNGPTGNKLLQRLARP